MAGCDADRVKSAIMANPLKPVRATVAGGFVAGLISGLEPRRVDPRALLRQAGIDPLELRSRAARVPLESYAVLYNTIVREIGDEGFGLFSRPLAPGTFEFLCRAMVGSASSISAGFPPTTSISAIPPTSAIHRIDDDRAAIR